MRINGMRAPGGLGLVLLSCTAVLLSVAAPLNASAAAPPVRSSDMTRGERASAARSAPHGPSVAGAARTIRDRYLVELAPGATVDAVAADYRGRVRVQRRFRSTITGFVARADAEAAAALATDARIRTVEPDQSLAFARTQDDAPWGLDRIDQRTGRDRTYNHDASGPWHPTGRRVHAYVVDSGVFAGHRDFGGRVTPGYDALGRGKTADCNGHGSHVAGTLAGATWGAAKGARVIPVRVGCSAIAKSDLLEGLEFIVRHHRRTQPAVANISISGPPSRVIDRAVEAVIADKVTVTVAAGNFGIHACSTSPGRVRGALTVGAVNAKTQIPIWSNYGSCLDLFAPGVGIRSVGHASASGTRVMDGTSMASPHVAGIAARYLAAHPDAGPAAVSRAILSHAVRGVVRGRWVGDPDRLLHAGGRAPTRLVANVSDRVVIGGDSVVLSGRLVNAVSGVPLASRSVSIMQRRLGTSTWSRVATRRSDRDGRLRVSVTITRPVELQLRHATTSETRRARSAALDVVLDPHARTRLTLAGAPGAPGQVVLTAVLTKTVDGTPLKGRVVKVLQRPAGSTSGWSSVGDAATNAAGVATFSHTPMNDVEYIARHRSTPTTLASRSLTVSVAVCDVDPTLC